MKRKWREEPPDNQLQQLKKPKKQPYYLSFLAQGSRFEFKMDSGAPATTGKMFRIRIQEFEATDIAQNKGLTIFSLGKNSSKATRGCQFFYCILDSRRIVDRSIDHTIIITVSKRYSIGTPHTSIAIGLAIERAKNCL